MRACSFFGSPSMSLTLYIGNKNYSSWSLRGWLLLRATGVAFEEVRLSLDFAAGSAFKRRIAEISPAQRVPVLVDDGFAVWDTLAIVEYVAEYVAEHVAERFPDRRVWPADRQQRARARSLCAEMHAGFGALRSHCPMNIEADLRAIGPAIVQRHPAVATDLQRIEAIWAEALRASGGPLLFGAFSAADAFFAPVAWRIRGHGLPVSETGAAYIDRLLALPAMQQWEADARAEHEFLADDEPYRVQRDGRIELQPFGG
jgi:glutathione S-transferase